MGTVLVFSARYTFAASNHKRTVVLVTSQGSAGEGSSVFFARLEAELKIAGFQVHREAHSRVPAEHDIETSLRSNVAFIFNRELTRTTELYFRTDDGRVNHLKIPIALSDEEEQVSSLHLVEILRVSFPVSTLVKEIVQPVQPKTTRRFSDELVGAVKLNSTFQQELSFPQMGVQLGAGYQYLSWLAGAFDVGLPLRGILLKEPEGDVRISCFSFGLMFHSVLGKKRIRPVLRAGYGLWVVRVQTDPALGFETVEQTEISSGPIMEAGLALHLFSRIAFSLSLFSSFTTSKLDYKMGERVVASVGRPLWGMSLGVLLLTKDRD